MPQAQSTAHNERVSGPSRTRALRDRGNTAVERVEAGAPGQYWSQLSAVDFMNSAFAFSALAVLCGFPFLAVLHAAIGGDFRQAIVARMGLDPAATRDVDGVISSGHAALNTLTVFGAVLLVVGALGCASTLQSWYQKIYDQPPSKGTLKHIAYQALGLVAFSIYIGLQVLAIRAVRRAGGGSISSFTLVFVSSSLFWWCSAYFLLYRRVGWRKLLPAGVATGFCITGLGAFSSLLFSAQITSGEESYGPAGVVLTIISYLVGFGVCLHLGAVFGRIWNDRGAQEASANPGRNFGDDPVEEYDGSSLR
jgi:membrane protein